MNAIMLTDIERAVSAGYKIDARQLRGKSAARCYSWPRFVLFHLARVHTRYSTTALGRIYGDRDHTTVLHGVRRVRELAEADDNFCAELAAIEAALHAAPKEMVRLRYLAAQLTGALFDYWPPRDPYEAMNQPSLFAAGA